MHRPNHSARPVMQMSDVYNDGRTPNMRVSDAKPIVWRQKRYSTRNWLFTHRS